MLKIKQVRDAKGLTQDEVASLSGIKKRSYVDYENEKTDIPFSKLQNIATALKVRVNDLFDEDITRYPPLENNITLDALLDAKIEQKVIEILKKYK